MITDADIEKLRQVFATKDDIQNMEKRFDAKFATKDDLNVFATKDDLKVFATTTELNNNVDGLIVLINALKEEMHQEFRIIREELNEVYKNTNNILANHENRITHLENTS